MSSMRSLHLNQHFRYQIRCTSPRCRSPSKAARGGYHKNVTCCFFQLFDLLVRNPHAPKGHHVQRGNVLGQTNGGQLAICTQFAVGAGINQRTGPSP